MCAANSTKPGLGVLWKTVSESCNLACDYCYYSTCGGKPQQIDRIPSDVLDRLIKAYMAGSSGSVSFAWQGGEPLLAGRDFYREVVYLQAKYAPPHTVISNAVQTNGTLIDEEWAEFFAKYSFLVGVSLDGPASIHDAHRVNAAGHGSYDRVMRGIAMLRRHRVDFNILTVIHEDHVGQAAELMAFYLREGFTHVQFIPCMDFRAQQTNRPPEFRITAEQYGDFLCESFDLWYSGGQPLISVRFFDNLLLQHLGREAELCTHQASCPKTLILEQNGDAYPCDFYISEEYRLGNVGRDRLEDIWANPIYEAFLNKKADLPDRCRRCEYRSFCHGGCPRNRSRSLADQSVLPDYFCESYRKVYAYSWDRMRLLASRIRFGGSSN
ncbi:anaerobic sulfatase maturase [Paenibacillus sp. NFR01]|uniref:anaerobic sulfatase maturase n=1 Tax=Paenibacillus sp. NFR01 TaxID=1566279 RepID=UPI0008CC3B0A|nr:anaerobic sulfatase maturase [Paenibacillus sp. NFR01]SET06630.1 uncharacterized protein SAMN03159358_0647 [Paenibacillus sp. NFR01]